MKTLYSYFLNSTGIETDTRKISKNCLFFCLTGANHNGNTFAQTAVELGALLVVIDDASFEIPGKTFLVDDTLSTLQQLANHHRKQFDIPVIGITGSNGKTTTKELITSVLETTFKVHATVGNLNNHIGVPLTLLGLNASHEIAVIEMGANKPGDIKELVEIAEPTHGIITNIGRAHLEGFKNLEGVVKTKKELYDYIVENDGVLFLNEADETLKSLIPINTKKSLYNTNKGVSGELIQLNPFVCMTWNEQGFESKVLTTQLVGKYNFINFLAAISIGRFFGVTAENCSTAIEEYTPSNNRSQVTKTERNTLIVDCYNANPTSMKSAVESFALIEAPYKVFILGEMREMGAEEATVHEELVQLTIEHRLSGFFVGEAFLPFKQMHPNAIFLKSVEPLIEHFEQTRPDDLMILLKGSRGIQLEKVIPYL